MYAYLSIKKHLLNTEINTYFIIFDDIFKHT